jgi:diguanylate cyclase (GGDEF)-like protein
MLISTIEHDLKSLKRGQKVMFIMMDVDYFKQINDTYGHDFGDHVLISLVRILQRNFAGDAMVGRMGGDEFSVYCRHAEIERRLPNIMEQVMREFDQIVVPGDRIRVLNFSYGVSWGEPGMHFEELYKKADKDLYEHKHIRRQYVDNSKGNV